MEERKKLTLKKPLSAEKQSQLSQALQPLHEQTEKEKRLKEKVNAQKEQEVKQKKKEEIKKTLAWLYQQFPACFNKEEFKPLKINIHQDIYPFLNREDAPSKAQIRNALTFYTRNARYLEAIVKDTHRFDLEGKTVEEITQEQKAYAQEELEKTLNRMKAGKQGKILKRREEKADKLS